MNEQVITSAAPQKRETETAPLMEAVHVKKYFKTKKGMLHAVDDVSLSIEKGETLGLVGESGCGKSTLGRVLLRLLDPTSGQIMFEGKDLATLNKNQMRQMRTQLQIIFQDPFSSLNPRKTVGQTIGEPLVLNKIITDKKERLEKVKELMDTVGLAQRFIDAYPHELDGGRRQRIGIARALAVDPKFVVCDEPVSALDVSIQAQILNLMNKLQEDFGLTYLFITHDLSVVNYFSDKVAVMYLGKLVEKAPAEVLFANTLHPYSQALLSAKPSPVVGGERRERILLKGEITSPINPGEKCRFADRCRYAKPECFEKCPELREVEPDHFVACHLV